MSSEDYFVCPHCGADVPANKQFCRECGASDDFGWNEDAHWDDEISDGYGGDDFDYDDYLEREFPKEASTPGKKQLMRFLFVTVIVLLCISFALMSIMGF